MRCWFLLYKANEIDFFPVSFFFEKNKWRRIQPPIDSSSSEDDDDDDDDYSDYNDDDEDEDEDEDDQNEYPVEKIQKKIIRYGEVSYFNCAALFSFSSKFVSL